MIKSWKDINKSLESAKYYRISQNQIYTLLEKERDIVEDLEKGFTKIATDERSLNSSEKIQELTMWGKDTLHVMHPIRRG